MPYTLRLRRERDGRDHPYGRARRRQALAGLNSFARFRAVAALLVAVAGVGALGASAARGAEDTFESYPVGTNLNGGAGGSGWANVWSAAGDVTVQAQSMADPNGLVRGGTQAARILPAASIANNDSILSRTFPALSGQAVYLGFLTRVESFEQGDFVQFQLSNGGVGNVNASASVGISNDAANSFFARLGQSANTTLSAIPAADGTDYLVVARFSKENGSATYNRADLFVNPTSVDELAQTPDATRTGFNTGLSELSLFNVRVNSLETDDTVFIDEVRVGESFAAVVPEPATAALAALALPLALLRRRRR